MTTQQRQPAKKKTTPANNKPTQVKVEVEDEADVDRRKTKEAAPAKKYEYTLVNVPATKNMSQVVAELNENGKSGWRVVTIELTEYSRNIILEREV